MHLLVYLRLVFDVFAIKDNTSGNREADEHDHEIHLGRGTLVHRFCILIGLLLFFDAVEGRNGAFDSSLLSELIEVFTLYHFFLIGEAHLFAFFWTVVKL